MRVVRVRHSAPAAAAVLVLSILLPGAAARAASPGAAGQPAGARVTAYPMISPIGHLTTAGQMVEANGHLFVSSGPGGSTVTILDLSGQPVTTITGLKGADGLAVSSKGDVVYVALSGSDEIALIDTSRLVRSAASFPVDACPRSLALASGQLFYSFGCSDDTSGPSGVASVNASSGGTPDEVPDQTGAGLVRAHGNTLAVYDGNQTITTYTAAEGGAVAKLNSATVSDVEDLAFTSNSSNLLVAASSPYQITSYAAATMTANQVAYPGVAYPQAVAADPKGRYVAAGFRSSTTTTELYGQSSGAADWVRFTTGPQPASWVRGRSDDAVVPQTMIFSPSGANVLALVKRAGVKGLFLFDSAIAPTASTVSVTVPKVPFGVAHTATAKVPPGLRVTFTLTDGGQHKALGTVSSNLAGTAKLRFLPRYSGTVTASVVGSPAKLPAQGHTKYRTASFTAYRMLGKHKTRDGIALYSSYQDVKVEFTTAPSEQRRAVVTQFQQRVHGHWRTRQTLHGDEGSVGVEVFYRAAPKHVELRIRVKVPADQYSGGSSATSQVIEIG